MAKQLTMFTPELPLPALRTIKRALVLLDQHGRNWCGIHLDSGCPRLAQLKMGPP